MTDGIKKHGKNGGDRIKKNRKNSNGRMIWQCHEMQVFAC